MSLRYIHLRAISTSGDISLYTSRKCIIYYRTGGINDVRDEIKLYLAISKINEPKLATRHLSTLRQSSALIGSLHPITERRVVTWLSRASRIVLYIMYIHFQIPIEWNCYNCTVHLVPM